MTPSLNLLGGAAYHTSNWHFFNHDPEVKPWARAGGIPNDTVVEMVKLYMGQGFPVESVEADILEALNQFSAFGAQEGLKLYLEAIGRDGRVLLAAIKRNFTRRPELWARLRS